MKIGELHSDIGRYLLEDCYCPNEIYDLTGFFYRCFAADDECTKLAQGKYTKCDWNFIACISGDQILVFDEENGSIINAFRVDATQNNVGIIMALARGESISDKRFDEIKAGETAMTLEKVMQHANFIMI